MARGSIRKRYDSKGKSSYQITLDLDRDPVTGKRQRRYKTVYGSMKQAEAELQKMLASPTENPDAIKSSVRLKDWLTTWLGEYLPDIAQTTRDSYREKIANHINPVLGNIPLNQLDTTRIQRFINGMHAQGLSPKTIRNTFNNLNAALNKAVVLKILTSNPCFGTVLPKLQRYQAQVYDVPEIQKALTEANGDTNLVLIIVLGAMLGLRRGEMAALRWEHVDFTNKSVTICENRVQSASGIIKKAPKSNAGKRTISIGDEVLDILQQAKDLYDDDCKVLWFRDLGYVLHKENGDPYVPDSISQLWDRFVTRKGLPRIRLHDLRHSNATLMIANGISAKVVQHRLGHADVSTTLQRYVHVQPSMDAAASITIDSLLFPQQAPVII